MKKINKIHIMSRYAFIVGATLVVVFAIVYKLSVTVFVEGEAWNKRANEELEISLKTQPKRGAILADDGTILADNIQTYTLFVDWNADRFGKKAYRKHYSELCDSLAAMFPDKNLSWWLDRMHPDKHLDLVDEHGNKKRAKITRIASGLDSIQCARIKQFPFFRLAYLEEKKNRVITGLVRNTNKKRVAPYGPLARRSIGMVDVKIVDHFEEMHGTSGLEKALDSLLYGVAGETQRTQVSNRLVNWNAREAIDGYDVHTTINVQMQEILSNELEQMCIESSASWGTAVLMEVATGDIKAISNMGRDPESGNYYEDVNHAVLGYELGSVLKVYSMLLALEHKKVTFNEHVPTGAVYKDGAILLRDEHYVSASKTPSDIIRSSSNIGIGKLLLRCFGNDPEEYVADAQRRGFLDPMKTGIAGEEKPRFFFKGKKSEDRITLSRMSYGYSMFITPMNILAVYNAIANDGKYVKPRLVKALSHDGVMDTVFDVSYIRQQICTPQNANYLRQMMHEVVWNEGTGRSLKSKIVEVAGKTGTSYMITNRRYDYTKKRTTFCGFFPYSKPKYSCIVVLEKGAFGAARGSGKVLLNVAEKLYARGLLDNTSEYTTTGNPSQGIMYASHNNNAELKEDWGLSNLAVYRTPQAMPQGLVPSVLGLSVREAVTILEEHGLNVKVMGNGSVVKQEPCAGDTIKTPGSCVTIYLKV